MYEYNSTSNYSRWSCCYLCFKKKRKQKIEDYLAYLEGIIDMQDREIKRLENEIHFLKTQLVYSFRENTGVGKRDSENALQENNYNMPKAIEWIKKKGLC